MKVWNSENEYDIAAPSGAVYRVSIHSVPEGFEDYYAQHYEQEFSQVYFNDCWVNIQRMPSREETREHENVG